MPILHTTQTDESKPVRDRNLRRTEIIETQPEALDTETSEPVGGLRGETHLMTGSDEDNEKAVIGARKYAHADLNAPSSIGRSATGVASRGLAGVDRPHDEDEFKEAEAKAEADKAERVKAERTAREEADAKAKAEIEAEAEEKAEAEKKAETEAKLKNGSSNTGTASGVSSSNTGNAPTA